MRARTRRKHTPPSSRIAARIRALRRARGLSQSQLAGNDFTKGFISLLETGRSKLSLHAARVLAGRLGIPMTDLLENDEDTADQRIQLALLEAERELAAGSPEVALRSAREVTGAGRLAGRVRRLEGRALLALDRAEAATQALERALEYFRGEQERELYLRTLFDLAFAHARLDRHQQALVLALEAERSLRAGEIVDRTFELQVEAFLAATYGRLGDHAAMEPHLRRAEELSTDVVDRHALASLYARLAAIEQERGASGRALELLRRSLAELEYLGRDRSIADTWHNMAVAYLSLNQIAKAREALDRAERLGRETGHLRLSGWIRVTRAKIALRSKRFEEAAQLSVQAGDSPDATALARGEAQLVRAQVLEQRRAPLDEVRKAYAAALDAWHDEPAAVRARALRLLADALARRGDNRGAFQRAREALELLRPMSTTLRENR